MQFNNIVHILLLRIRNVSRTRVLYDESTYYLLYTVLFTPKIINVH